MRGRSESGDTAKTLILVGLILDIIGAVVLLLIGLFILIFPLLGEILLGLALIGLVWVVLVWLFSYRRVVEGDYEGARTPTLVFAILSLVTFGLIPGILFLIAYIKLGDAIREGRVATPAWGAPYPPFQPQPPAPGAGARFCTYCGAPGPASGAYCQNCGAPLKP